MGWVVKSSIKLTQDKQEFGFEFCNFVVGFTVCCLAFRFEFEQSQKIP